MDSLFAKLAHLHDNAFTSCPFTSGRLMVSGNLRFIPVSQHRMRPMRVSWRRQGVLGSGQFRGWAPSVGLVRRSEPQSPPARSPHPSPSVPRSTSESTFLLREHSWEHFGEHPGGKPALFSALWRALFLALFCRIGGLPGQTPALFRSWVGGGSP